MGTIVDLAKKLNQDIVEELSKEKQPRSGVVALSNKDDICAFCKDSVLKGTRACKKHQKFL